MMKWTKCAIRFLRISRPGVRVPSIAPENAVKSKDFMAFLFSSESKMKAPSRWLCVQNLIRRTV